LEMCHPRVSGLICTKNVHPKMSTNNLYILRLPTSRNSKSLREIITH
jgi:hypothetical protein